MYDFDVSYELIVMICIVAISLMLIAVSRILNDLDSKYAKASTELAQAQNNYFELYNNAPEMLLSIDLQTRKILHCNEILLKKTLYTREEIIGKNIVEMYHAKSHSVVAEYFGKINEISEISGVELIVVKKDGTCINVSLTSTFIRDEAGRPLRSRSSWRDLTPEKEVQRALESERQAKETSRIKSEFLSIVSHEIRSPLNSVIGMSDMLLETPLNAGQMECVDTIQESSSVLLALVNDILDLSKAEADKLKIQSEAFDFHNLIHKIQKNFHWSVNLKGIDFEVIGLENAPRFIKGDAIRLKQILINIIGNAVKFTQNGSVCLQILSRNESDKKVSIEFLIRDTGMGMASEALAHLFEPFFQSDPKATFGGSGLGLTISKKLVELMSGSIQVESEYKRGTTFKIQLPFEIENSIIKTSESSVDEEEKFLRLICPEILVVEDSVGNQKVLKSLLEKMGCKVHVSENGMEALEVLKSKSFHLIFMDCHMPVLDGYATTNFIRNSIDTHYSQIPIIAMTADVLDDNREKCLTVGMNDYMTKPIRFQALKECVWSWLKKGSHKVHVPTNNSHNDLLSIDLSIISELKMLDSQNEGNTLLGLKEIFNKNAPCRILNIKTALQKDEFDVVSKESHALKSSSAYLGAVKFGRICDEIQKSVQIRDYQKIEESILLLDMEFGNIIKTLDAIT